MDRSLSGSGEQHHRLDNLSISGINLSDDGSSSVLGQSRSGPIRVISSLRAHRGPYARPSALDNDSSRYSPYSRRPMLIRAKKVVNEDPTLTKMSTTAERIVQTIASCSTQVVSCKKSPIFEKLKTLKPDFSVSPRLGPPTQRLALDTSCTNYNTSAPQVPERARAASVEKPKFNVQDLIDDLFPSTGAEPDIVNGPSGVVEDDENVQRESIFDSSGRIIAEKLTFEGWSLDKFNNMDEEAESSESETSESSESETENDTSNQQENASDVHTKSATKGDNSVNIVPFTSAQKTTWECPTCLVSSGEEITKCPCCDTANPNVEAKAPPSSDADSKWECPCCMVQVNASDSECPCCGTRNPDAKTVPVAIKSSPKPTPFQFGFKSTPASTASATVTSSFVFGAKNPEPQTLKEKFKIGFPDTSTSERVETEAPDPPFPPSFSFGFNVGKPSAETTSSSSRTYFAPAGKVSSPKDTTDTVDFVIKPSTEEKWECPSCMVYNLISQSKCQCCFEPQPAKVSTPSDTPSKVSKGSELETASTLNKTESVPSMKPIAESTPAPEKSPLPKIAPTAQPTVARRKIVFGLKPEDEEDKAEKPNPFCGFVFKSVDKSSDSEVVKPKSAVIEPWTCRICSASNTSGKERCSGCQSLKPVATPAPELPQGKSFEHYTFNLKSTVEPNKTPVKPMSFPPLITPSTTVSSNVISFGLPTTAKPGAEVQFGALPASTTTTASSTPALSLSTPTFSVGTPTEGLKRKAVDTPQPGGFNFTGSSEPNLKLRATGAGETPTPLPSLKSGSVLEALKQPGFGSQPKFETPASTAATPITTTSAPAPFTAFTPAFSLPTQTPSTPSQITSTPAPVFQFGSTPSVPSNNPPAVGSFAFGGSASITNPSNTPFGLSAPAAPGGFHFQPPTSSSTPAPYTPPSFSMTPNLNFGIPTFGASAQPFNFQGQTNSPNLSASGGGDGPQQPARRIRKAVRRGPR